MRPVKQLTFLLLFLMAISSCEDLPPKPELDNIFDPENPETGGDPFGLTAELLGTSIELNWNSIYIENLDGYNVYRSEAPEDIYDTEIAETEGEIYIDDTIENGHKYFYLVTANNYLGETRSSTLVPFEVDARPLLQLNNGDQYTISSVITANILAAGADSMRVSNDGTLDDEPWEPYATSRELIYNNTPTVKSATLQVHYPDGDTSEFVSDVILPRDLTPQVVVGNGSGFTVTPEVEISVSDAGAVGIVLWEGATPQNPQSYAPVPEIINLTLSDNDGAKLITMRFWNDFYSLLTVENIILDTNAEIIQLTHDGEGRTLMYGGILNIELVVSDEDTGGVASVDITDELGNMRMGIELQDNGGGYYGTQYIIGAGDNIEDGIITGHFTDLAGNVAEPVTSLGMINIEFLQSGMVFVPAGEFSMGNSHSIHESDELPVHTVFVSDFWIGQTEVSNAEYAEFLCEGNHPYYDNRMEIVCYVQNSDYEPIDSLANKPVRFVNWDAADAYAAWKGMRLPTEAEWEKASRGTENLRFPWGELMPYMQICNFMGSNDPYEGSAYPTTPAGFFNGDAYGNFITYSNDSPYGAYDMLGNVSEWCSDYYSANFYDLPAATDPDPENTNFSNEKVVRSGSWGTPMLNVYCANRYAYSPDTPSNEIGFRLAMDP